MPPTPPSLGGIYVFYNVGTDVSVIVCQSAVDAYKAVDGWKISATTHQ